jgi:uncharacterized protein YlxW (UPF0749 family)
MKRFLILFLFAMSIAHGWTQQVLINPTSVTLTRQGSVTVIVTAKILGHDVTFDAYLNATVGTIKATYFHAIYTNSGTAVGSWMEASAVASGTLEAGTYPLTIETNQDGWDAPNPDPVQFPRQITVILWNENAEGGGSITLNDLTLTYQSATEQDKAAFQTLIVSLVQQKLDALQGQIMAQQNQINALEQLVADQQSAFAGMQNSQTAMQGQINLILGQLAALQTSDGSQQTAINDLQQSHAQLQAQYNNLQNQTAALQNTVTSQQELIDSLHQSLTAMQGQYSQLSDSLASLTTHGSSTITGTTDDHSSKSGDTLAKIGIGLGAAGVISGIVNFFLGDGGGEHSSTPSTQNGSHK